MGKKSIITRMLFNLKGLYYQRDDYHKSLSVVDRILMLKPGILTDIRDRGMLYMQTSLFSKALADLEYYLEHANSPEDVAYIEAHIKTLRGVVAVELAEHRRDRVIAERRARAGAGGGNGVLAGAARQDAARQGLWWRGEGRVQRGVQVSRCAADSCFKTDRHN